MARYSPRDVSGVSGLAALGKLGELRARILFVLGALVILADLVNLYEEPS